MGLETFHYLKAFNCEIIYVIQLSHIAYVATHIVVIKTF